MTVPSRWVLASANRGKLAEIAALLRGLSRESITVVAQSDFGIESPPETGLTFVENALLKARHAARLTGLPAIADDSGIAVDALGGAPGILSARFAGPNADDAANVRRLLESLADAAPGQRGASFHCVLVALTSAMDPAPLIATGRWYGSVALEPAGTGGFGYDPVFFDPTLGKTAAELPPDVKNSVSHRGQALRRLVEQFAAAAAPGPAG